jgi:hypothetical protein
VITLRRSAVHGSTGALSQLATAQAAVCRLENQLIEWDARSHCGKRGRNKEKGKDKRGIWNKEGEKEATPSARDGTQRFLKRTRKRLPKNRLPQNEVVKNQSTTKPAVAIKKG